MAEFNLAKRGKKRVCADYTLVDIYNEYSKEHKNDGYSVDKSTFDKVTRYFNQRVIDLIIDESREFILPVRLGRIRIRKRKTILKKGVMKIDWAASKKNKKILYHLNEHSKGYYYRFYWNKVGSNATNGKAYFFSAGRINDRRLAKTIKKGETDYFL